MALDLTSPQIRRPGGKPTILQIIPAPEKMRGTLCLALARTDNGTEVLGVDYDGKLFVLETE